jgi:hypothetical protein
MLKCYCFLGRKLSSWEFEEERHLCSEPQNSEMESQINFDELGEDRE